MSEELRWIHAIRAGDLDSYRIIVVQYKSAVYSVAYGVLGDYHLAEDASQETFLQAFLRKRRVFRLCSLYRIGSENKPYNFLEGA
ncbi:hypothetical protein GC093_22155 [Paenibacillus sp. LMG 31456]|uniref:RNA polymerase sigma-70 region 2 domain-containing protein n=1 Tax=Paenibacillus foliorum TaxID=2654974 RepID=A0A972GS79_9BACL|nr:hypothetical protein [Paenibacillus foliorum]